MNSLATRVRGAVVVLTLAVFVLPSARAAAADGDDDGWHVRLTPYGWVADTKGDARVGRRSVSVDYSLGDAFDALGNIFDDDNGGDNTGNVVNPGTDIDFAFMTQLEVGKGPWSVLGDFIYVDTTTRKVAARVPQANAELGFKGINIDGALVRRLIRGRWGRASVLAGARFTNLNADLDLNFTDNTLATASSNKSWASPIIGARGRLTVVWRLFLQGYVDIGGFGLGSDFTWQGFGAVGVAVPYVDILAGWRYLSTDYEDDDFVWNVHHSGPALGVSVHF